MDFPHFLQHQGRQNFDVVYLFFLAISANGDILKLPNNLKLCGGKSVLLFLCSTPQVSSIF